MTNNRATSLGLLGMLLLGCGSTADGDDDSSQGGAGTGGAMMVTEGGRGGAGSGGSSPGSGGAANSAGTTSAAGSGGTSALGGSGGSGGDSQGGRSVGGAGSGGASAGVGGTEPMGGAGGESGRGMGGRMATGGRAMGGAGGRSAGGMGGVGGMGTSGMGMGGGAGGGLSNCPASGHVTYTLTKSANPTADEQKSYDLITEAMDKAIDYYNCYTNITKATTVTYVSSVETADGNSNGSIRFGGKDYMEYITAMHEIAHTVGVGTVSQWSTHVVNGIWNGAQATAKLRELTGIADDELHGDTQHFWPYGLNYTSEVKSEADVIDHCYIVVALRADMGLQ